MFQVNQVATWRLPNSLCSGYIFTSYEHTNKLLNDGKATKQVVLFAIKKMQPIAWDRLDKNASGY